MFICAKENYFTCIHVKNQKHLIKSYSFFLFSFLRRFWQNPKNKQYSTFVLAAWIAKHFKIGSRQNFRLKRTCISSTHDFMRDVGFQKCGENDTY